MNEVTTPIEDLIAQWCADLACIIESLSTQHYLHNHGSGSIGEHVRHGLDHLLALLSGAESEIIDYEQRRRGWPGERDQGLAVQELRRLSEAFSQLSGADPARPLTVVVQVDPALPPAQWSSTWGRECVAILSHEVHHAAILRPSLAAAGCQLPAHFGVAASTVTYRNSCAASA